MSQSDKRNRGAAGYEKNRQQQPSEAGDTVRPESLNATAIF